MEKKLKIIVVEDSENDTLLEIRLIEQAGYRVKYVRVETKEELETALKADEWDVVLSDFTMPHFSGAEALKVVRSKDDFIPFIFVSGTIGEDRAVKTLKDGASDYILKIDPKRLVSSIERELRDKELRLQRIRAQDQLRESEERYRDLFDSAPVGYHEIDAGGIITRVNRMELKLFGYERDEMVGKPAWLFVADPEASKERVAAKLAGRINTSEHFDRVYVRKDGSTFPATIEESYIRDKMGTIVGIRTVVEDVTEKRLIEERLRLATLVIENSSSILFRCLPEMGWPISYVSDNVTDWGYDHSALSSGAFSFSGLIAQADMDRVQQEVERNTFEHRDRFSIDFRVLKPDASAIWVSAHCTVMRDRIGNVTYYQGVLTDINDRKKAEESLKLFRELIDQSYDAIEVVDPETGRFVDGNEAVWSSLGYTREEFLGLTFSDVHPLVPSSKLPEISEMLGNAGSKVFESIHRRKDGTTFPVEGNTRFVQLDRGFLITVARDISERKQAELMLQKTQEKFRDLVEMIPDWTWEVDKEGKYTYVSPRVKDLLGYESDEVLGKTPFDFMLPDEAARVGAAFREIVPAHRPIVRMENVNRCKNGQLIVLETSALPILDDKGGLSGYRGIDRDITERKRAEESIRLEAEKYKAMLETTTDGFARLDGDGKFLEMNDAFCRMTGYNREELLGLKISDIEASEKPEETVRHIDKTMKSGFDRFESRHRRKDGTVIYVEISVTYWRRPGQLLMFSRDITKAKRTDERFQLLAHTITSVSDCVTVTDTEGVIVFVNKAFLKSYGYSETEVIGKHIEFVRSPLNDPALGATIDSATLAGGWQGELLNRRKDGTQFPIHLSSSVVRNERGEVIAMVGVARDISERRQAEEELRLFRQLVDHTNDALEVIDPESGRFLDVNQKACADLGYTRDELLRMTVFDIDPALDREQFSGAGAASGESIPPVIETLHRRKDGSTFPVEVSISAVKLERTYFVVITRDITERKALEEQYRRAQRMDMLGALAGGIAHDLNNVLTPIALAIEMLQRKYGSDQKTARLLSTLESTVSRGTGVVKQILALARGTESQRDRLEPVSVLEDMRRIIDGTFPKNISHAVTVEKGTGLLFADRAQIHQILMNLCINARDAMPGGGKLSLSARNVVVDEQYAGMIRGAKAGNYVLLEVKDTGIGIKKENVERMFEPFFTTKAAGNGAGLGLAIVRGLVESHGGFIEVESELHKGSTFKVFLPAAAPSEQVSRAEPELKPRLGQGELVLVVDDEAAIREITKATLEAYGYSVLLASDGSEAVALFAKHRDEVALVVSDMAMPIMNGTATVKALRKINPGVKVIVATGFIDSGDTTELSGTVNAILKKPYSASSLMKVVSDILSMADSKV